MKKLMFLLAAASLSSVAFAQQKSVSFQNWRID